uniref:LRR receptor-like serine/threonine-protein kinase FLS2 n=1 Tax=Sedum alfredii TaxID=439688 RepID=A0A410N635_9MAGN|nr:LRR receptor-like serine/threonine-protein kinase FLS2 [Sedum alfredii]
MMKLLWILLVSLLSLIVKGQLPNADIMALLAFKKGIKYDPTGFVLNSWNEESIDFNGCPSSWNGIVCNGGNVAGVVLEGQGLSGDVDLSVFGNLTKLVKLSLSKNSITGRIPSNIGGFISLEYLDLSDNLFFSSLPAEIGKLGSLKNLSLAGNNFSGSIPESISELSSILSIDLSCNSLSGPLPSSLTKLTSLLYLNLSCNAFVEEMPKGFDLMTNLVVLDLHSNMLVGELDTKYLLLSSAVHVDFSSNMLISSPSMQNKFLPGLSETIKYLNLSRNQLKGSLVSSGEAPIFGNLKILDLSYNQLSGELPGFNFVYDLEVLRLSNNKFIGFFPNDLLKGDALTLADLDLSGNNLSGPITFITSSTLHSLNLSSNSLTGELPLLTGSCAVLDLSNNQFHGNLSRLAKWANIEHLDLSRNGLTGPIPEVTSQFLRLSYLNISHNSLSGFLPKVLSQFPKLTVLDLSANQLDGSLLTALLTIPTLQELHLGNNLLSGDIKFAPMPSSKLDLRILDLSHNQISGYFPDQFGSLVELQMLNLAKNNLSGSLPTSISDMSSLTALDLSENHFTGPLPSNLPGSLESLNVSYNDLTGVVPENLRHFSVLSFYPGNSGLIFPNAPPGSYNNPSGNSKRKPIGNLIKILIIVASVVAVMILALIVIILLYIRISRRRAAENLTNKDLRAQTPSTPSSIGGRNISGTTLVCAEDVMTSKKGSSSEMISPERAEKKAPPSGLAEFSSAKNSGYSWSPESGGSLTAENLSRVDVRSSDKLVGELHFLDDTVSLTPEELSRAPAEVLGRSSHGTSYRATLDNGMFLTVKWLREGVAKPRKEFVKEAKKFANIRHPNLVGLRGYYWGPTQHEKLILSDYISPGSLPEFLYDRPGRKVPPLSWSQRLKISVDVARGLNYLHFDRAAPHGNLKANNVLLEGPDLNARISDYCLHRLMTQAGTVEQIQDAGVQGYRAPELTSSKKQVPSFKADVYAFGVLVLELLSGKCAGEVISADESGMELTEWVRLRAAEGKWCDIFDEVLVHEMGENASIDKGMKEMLGIGLRCIRSSSERPGVKTVYEDLSSI